MKNASEATFALPLEGVESEHCALIVDKGLASVPDIRSHSVELNNRRAIISTSKPDSAIPAAVHAIRDLGYGITSVKKNWPVLKMTCASCAVSVESMLKATTGVLEASVNFASATVFVDYVPGITTPETLKRVVQSIGYDLVIEDGEKAGESLEDIQAQTYGRLQMRTIWAVLFTLPVVVIGMFFMEMTYANEIMWAFSTPVILWLGRDFFINAWKQARHGSTNMDTLVALSTGVAYLFSVFNTLFPEYWHVRGLHAHVYFEAASVVIAFILLGKLLEEKAKGNTSTALKKLMGLQAKTVTRITTNGDQVEIPSSEVLPGDVLLAKPGEKIAVDGLVEFGSSFIDESAMNGEPVPVAKSKGDSVLAGTLNQKGVLHYRALKVGSETLLAHIIQMVQHAQGSKAPVQKLVDKIASIFVPVVLVLSVLTLVVWWIFGGENGFTQGMLAMVTVLVIACPCALGLATPTAIMVGVGKGAEKGILIKDAESLERAKNLTALVLDKTGTITEGKPSVAGIQWAVEDSSLLSALVSIEKMSEHPLAEAVVRHFPTVKTVVPEDVESLTGKGITAVIGGNRFFVGSADLLRSNGISIPESLQNPAEKWSKEAKTVIWFGDSHSALAVLSISDKVKNTSREAVKSLQNLGIEVFMLTGDAKETALAVAAETGIRNVNAGVLPDRKASFIRELQEKGHVVGMVGDGINDSAALAQADVSIAMGKGSDIAMDVAKMTLISSDLIKIPQAIQLSRQTVSTIRQNLFWAFIYNLIGIPVAAGLLYPFTGFLLNPMIAGAAMALSSVSVVANSLRLKWKK